MTKDYVQGAHGNYWRPENESKHRKKRDIPFSRADEAVADPNYRIDLDEIHSDADNRQTILGKSAGEILRVTVTSDPALSDGQVIISVRKASKAQQEYYFDGSNPQSYAMGMKSGKLKRPVKRIINRHKDKPKSDR